MLDARSFIKNNLEICLIGISGKCSFSNPICKYLFQKWKVAHIYVHSTVQIRDKRYEKDYSLMAVLDVCSKYPTANRIY